MASTPITYQPSMRNQDAKKRAFGITEILESILLEVPEPDLRCKVQRVCKAFQETTQGSQALKRRLFLLPDWDRDDLQISESVPGLIASSYLAVLDTKEQAARWTNGRVKTNSPLPLAGTKEIHVHYKVNKDAIYQAAEGLAAQQRASPLHSLYLTQPPIKKLVYQLMPSMYYLEQPIENPDGLTVAEVLEFVRVNFVRNLKTDPHASVSVTGVWVADKN